MPSNNKRTSKKNNKKTKSSKKKTTSNNASEAIHDWAATGRMDAKGLSRSVPDVAEAIRDGSLEPSEVPKMVQQANQDQYMAELQKHLPKDFKGMKIHRIGSLEIMTGAEPLLCDLARVASGGDHELSHAFAHDFFGGSNKKVEQWGNVRDKIHMDGLMITHVEDYQLIIEIHQAYNRACEKWKSRIVLLTKKPFQEHCWSYKDSPDDFLLVVGQLIHRNENFSMEHVCQDAAYTQSFEYNKKVEAAARGVKAGWDTIRHECWECGNRGGAVYKCSLCKAARYCSQECQRKSWKSGHKGACAELCTMYQAYMENHRRIDQALKLQNENNETPMCEGCPLPPAGTKDYMLLPMLLTNYTFPVRMSFDIVGNGGVSIDQMYKSLAEIVRGRTHWMFEDTFKGTLQEYLDSTVLERANYWEMDYMQHGLMFLALDISKIKPSYAIPVVVNLMKLQLRKASPKGELMSVKRFIGIYYRFGMAERGGFEDPSARLENLAKCLELMMNHFHKESTPSFDVDSLMEACQKFRWYSAPSMVDPRSLV